MLSGQGMMSHNKWYNMEICGHCDRSYCQLNHIIYHIVGKLLHGANFCIFLAHNVNAKLEPQSFEFPKFLMCKEVYFNDGSLPLFHDSRIHLTAMSGTLSSLVSPVARKQANEAVKTCVNPKGMAKYQLAGQMQKL